MICFMRGLKVLKVLKVFGNVAAGNEKLELGDFVLNIRASVRRLIKQFLKLLIGRVK